MELAGLEELLADAVGGGEEPGSPRRTSEGLEEEDPEWTEVLQGLTGKRLKTWLQQATAALGEALEGPGDDQPLLVALKRCGLLIPCACLYVAGAKVRLFPTPQIIVGI